MARTGVHVLTIAYTLVTSLVAGAAGTVAAAAGPASDEAATAALGMFSSSLCAMLVIFPIAAHPNESFLLHLNPMTPIIVAYQRTILDGVDPEWSWLAYSAAVAVGVFAIGFAFYHRASDSFEEEL